MKQAIYIIMGIILLLNSLDTIYVGIYNSPSDDRPKIIEIEPETDEFNLTLDLLPGQEAYYFYNRGFGRYE